REAQSIDAFRDHQQRAFNAERDRWIASGQAHFDSQESAAEEAGDAPLQPGEQGVESPVSGNLWQVQTEAGRLVRAGDVLVVLESMKMEIPLLAPCDGRVQQVNVQPGSAVRAGQRVAVIIEEKA
ncbi:acetyl-CoA carboxylase biotin carboxyl carrier protein subunit, partial [Klebsiella pneumoniae]